MLKEGKIEELDDSSPLSPLQTNILDLLEREGPMTRTHLVQKLNRARTTIYDHLVKLMAKSLVTRVPVHDGKRRGRPKILFKLVQGA